MLKYVFLAGAMTMSVPLLAQTAPAQDSTAPSSQTAPAQIDPMAPVEDKSMTPSAPTTATDSAAPQDSTTTAQASPAPDASQLVATPTQVADVVTQEFPTYDKDSNGTLNKGEFTAWMVALKSASDPSTKADAPATKTWVGQAFAQADTDKSKSISKSELTGFLGNAQG